jgi:HPt (histidine-containing phosphotransfer) domain-containing protein
MKPDANKVATIAAINSPCKIETFIPEAATTITAKCKFGFKSRLRFANDALLFFPLPFLHNYDYTDHDSKRNGAQMPNTDQKSTAESSDVPFLNPAVIEKLKSFDPEGKRGLVKRLVGMYLESAPSALPQLMQFASSGEYENLRKEAHRLKTTHANLGLMRMAHHLEKIEAHCFSASSKGEKIDHQLVMKLTEKVLADTELALEALQKIVNEL